MEEAVDLFVRRGNARNGVYIGVDGDLRLIYQRRIAHQTEYVIVIARNHGHAQTHILERMNELADFLFRGAFFHGNNHEITA